MESPYQVVDYSLPIHMDKDKLWKHVVIDEDGCWIYSRGKNRKGYGAQSWEGLPRGTHVIAFMIANGVELSTDEQVGHHCDKPPCTKPVCLFQTTNKENYYDSRNKGRAALGERNSQAKLNEQQITEIITKAATGLYSDTEIGLEYGVNRSAINRIKHGKRWTHIRAKNV